MKKDRQSRVKEGNERNRKKGGEDNRWEKRLRYGVGGGAIFKASTSELEKAHTILFQIESNPDCVTKAGGIMGI